MDTNSKRNLAIIIIVGLLLVTGSVMLINAASEKPPTLVTSVPQAPPAGEASLTVLPAQPESGSP